MPASIPIIFGGEQLVLLADRALHWPARQTLILADVHLGKDAAFRSAGLPVPAGNSGKDLQRIATLLALTGAARLIILGDMVHSRASHQPELAAAFQKWRAAHNKLEILLVRGNHDHRAGRAPEDWRMTEVAELHDAGPMTLAHKPQASVKPLLCGHVHPTVLVRDFDGSCVTIPCFVVDPVQLMLPAFGSFTGGYKMDSQPGRNIYATTGKSVVSVPMEDTARQGGSQD